MNQIQPQIQQLHQSLNSVTQVLSQLQQSEQSNAQQLQRMQQSERNAADQIQKLQQICFQLDQNLNQISNAAQQMITQTGSHQFGTPVTQQLGLQPQYSQQYTGQQGYQFSRPQYTQQQFKPQYNQQYAQPYSQLQNTSYQYPGYGNIVQPTQTGVTSYNQYVPQQQQHIASGQAYTGSTYGGQMPGGLRQRQQYGYNQQSQNNFGSGFQQYQPLQQQY